MQPTKKSTYRSATFSILSEIALVCFVNFVVMNKTEKKV